MANTFLDPLKNTSTLSGGNLTSTSTSNVTATGAYGLLRHAKRATGTVYFEVQINFPSGNWGIGLVSQIVDIVNATDSSAHNNVGAEAMFAWADGNQYTRSSGNSLGVTPATGDIYAFVFDFANKLWWAKNVTQSGNWNGSGTADPATGTGGISFPATQGNGETPGGWVPFVQFHASSQSAVFNFGDTTFAGTVPSGITSGWPQAPNDVGVEYQEQVVNGSSSTSASLDVSTNGTDRVIVIQVTTGHSSGLSTVSSISDTAGLTWAQRAANDLNFSGSNHTGLEVWWAHASSQLTGDTITVNYSTADSVSIMAFAVAGAGNPSSPWDGNGSLPASATHAGGGSVPSVSVSTTSAKGSVFQFEATANNTVDPTVDTSNQLLGPAVTGGSVASYQEAGYTTYSSALSGASITGGSSLQPWSFIVDAIPASTTPSGTWASTEPTDLMSMVGYPGAFGVLGNLLSFEARDTFAAVGYPASVGTWTSVEASDRFSAFGRQPLSAVWASTEAKDIMVAHGIGLGEDGVFITVEGADIFAAVGSTPIAGTFVTTETPDHFRAIGAGVTFAGTARIVTFTT